MNRLATIVAFLIVALTAVGCNNNTVPILGHSPVTQGEMEADLSPMAVSNSDFAPAVVVYPVAKGADEARTDAPRFVVTATEARLVPEADTDRMSHLACGKIISCPQAIFETWPTVKEVYGEPAQKTLLDNLSPQTAQKADGKRSVSVSAGPLANDEIVSYTGHSIVLQTIQPIKIRQELQMDQKIQQHLKVDELGNTGAAALAAQ